MLLLGKNSMSEISMDGGTQGGEEKMEEASKYYRRHGPISSPCWSHQLDLHYWSVFLLNKILKVLIHGIGASRAWRYQVRVRVSS